MCALEICRIEKHLDSGQQCLDLREADEIDLYCKMWAQWEVTPQYEVSRGMPSDEVYYSQEKHPQGGKGIGTQCYQMLPRKEPLIKASLGTPIAAYKNYILNLYLPKWTLSSDF